jgi:hypothetical protein
MSLYFVDSSAYIKRYVTEFGSGWLQSLVMPSAGHRILIAQITPIEIVSGLARKQREFRISSRTLEAAMLLMQRHINRETVVVQLSASVENAANTLLVKHPLRAYDAVQLASALVANQQLIQGGLSGLSFISSDSRLLAIALVEGLITDDPNNYP